MTLEAWQYGNPEMVLMRKQETATRQQAQCGSCAHHRSIEFRGEVVHACIFKRQTYGVRCKLFEITGGK